MRGSQHCVAIEGETEPIDGGCHDARADAERHMAALSAAEPGARAAAGARIIRPTTPAGCSCQGACTSCATTAHAAAAVEPLSAPFPAPEYPTAEMFERPAWLERGQGLTVMDDGTVAGYFHDGPGSCIIGAPGYPGQCTEPTPSPTGYAAFHQNGPITLADGSTMRVGVIGQVGGHANPYVSASVASRHYADPSCQRILCVAHDDFDEQRQWHGAFIAGVLVPGLTYGDVAQVQRSALSGDWRPMDAEWWDRNGVSRQAAAAVGFFDCIGPTLVTRPGLPLVRAYRSGARAASVLGGLGGVHLEAAVLSSARPDEGDLMQTITLADGTVLEVPDGSTIESREGGVLAVTLPPAAAPVAAAPADAEPAAEPAPAPEPQTELVGRMAAIEGTLTEVVVPFIEEQRAVQEAEIETRRAALAEPVELPAEPVEPHDYADIGGNGTCDDCGVVEIEHDAAMVAAGRGWPVGEKNREPKRPFPVGKKKRK